MSRRNRRQGNRSEASLGRRRQARRTATLVEALEIRRLLSQPYVLNSTGVGGTGTEYWANVNPYNSNEIYMETDMGEVWHTTNDGLFWQTINEDEQLAATSMYSGVQFTNNPNIQYAINGSGGTHNQNQPMETTNDGQTWSVLPNWTNGGVADGNLLADPNNTSDLIISQNVAGGGYNYYFSSDGGASFTQFASLASSSNVNWAAGAFFDPNGHNFYFATDHGLWISTNSGSNWTQSTVSIPNLGTAAGYFSFTGSDQGGTTRLFAITWDLAAFPTSSAKVINGDEYKTDFAGLYSMTNPTSTGASWTNDDGTTFGSTGTGLPLYPRIVQMTTITGNVNDVWVGGGDPTHGGTPIVYGGNTTDSGTSWSWTRILQTGNDSPISTNITMVNMGSGYSSTPTVTFAAPQAGGITATGVAVMGGTSPNEYVSSITVTNVGASYQFAPAITISGGGATGTNVATATAVDVEQPDQNVYAKSLGDNTSAAQGSFGWAYLGETYTFTVNPKNSNIMTFTGSGSEFETINGTSSAPTWYDITEGGPASPNGTTLSNGFIFETPTTSNPDPYYSNNSVNGYEWDPAGALIPAYLSFVSSSQNETSVWSMSFPAPNVELSDDTDVTSQFSSTGGQQWELEPILDNTAAPNSFYQSVYDPKNGMMYAVTSDNHNLYLQYDDNADDDVLGKNFVMTSSDDGGSWTLEGSGFYPLGSGRSIAYDPDNTNILYAGLVNETYGGIWETTDALDGANANWFRLGDGTGASATATFSTSGGGTITGFVSTSSSGGSGYTPSSTIPVFLIYGGGNNATATATTDATGHVTGLTVTNAGTGYTSAPTVYITSSTDQPENIDTSATATATISGGAVTGFTGLVGGGGYAPSSIIPVYLLGGGGSGATATATSNANGIITAINFDSSNGGSGYTSAPNVNIIAPADHASDVDSNWTSMHNLQLMVLPDNPANSADLKMVDVSVMDASQGYGSTAGIFTCTSTDSGQNWTTWTSTTQNPADVSAPGSSTDLSAGTYSLTIDPNNTNDWYVTNVDGNGASTAGFIYESTNAGGTWSVYSNVGQGFAFWIQPGGTEALFAAKNVGLEYTPNYKAANPQFYYVQGFPFTTATNIYQNPFDPNQIWVTSFGNGMWEGNLGQIATASVPQNVTATAMSSTEALVTWTPENPLPSSYSIQYSTTGTGNWSTPVNVPTDGTLLGVGGYEIISGGSGYTGTQIAASVTGGGGTGAIVTANETSGAIISINILAAGSGYTSAPTITITGGGGSGASVIGTLSSDPQSYMVTGLTGGTLYYFQVSSVDSAGTSYPSTSVADARTDSVPDLFASDEFTQTTGNLNGTGSGVGWTGNWTSGTNATVVSGSWDPTGGPNSSGNSVQLAPTASGGSASRTLSGTTVGNSGTVLWASFDEYTQSNSSLLFGNSTNGFGFGTPQYGTYAGFYTITSGSITYYNQVPAELGNGTAHFFVAKIDFETDATNVTLYVDPTPGLTYPNATSEVSWAADAAPATKSIPTSSWTPVPTSTVTLTVATNGAAVVKYDEIRLGDTYTDVAPLSGVAVSSAPTGITANDASTSSSSAYYAVNYVPNTIDLNWTNNATNQEGEYIQQSGGGSGWTTIAKIYDPNALVSSYAVTDLSANTAYKFQVASYNNTGTSSYDATASTTTMVALPGTTTLTATVTGTQAVLNWTAASGATGYDVQYVANTARADSAIAAGQTIADGNNNQLLWTTATTSGTSYTLTLPTNSLYYFRIIPYNASGTGPSSSAQSGIDLSAPTSLTANPATPTQAYLTWSDSNMVGPNDETGVRIDLSTNGGSTWTNSYATAPANSTWFMVTGLTASTTYTFRVEAIAPNSTSVASSTAATTTLANVAGLNVYEGFSYQPEAAQPGPGELSGQTGGFGWSGGWSQIDNSSGEAISTSMTAPTNGTVAANLLITGNADDSNGSVIATRTLATPLNASNYNNTAWVSFLVETTTTKPSGYLDLISSTGSNSLELGFVSSNDYSMYLVGSGGFTKNSGTRPNPGETHLLVFEILYGSTNATVNMWVDPSPTNTTGPGTALISGTSTIAMPTVNQISLNSNTGDEDLFDELRIGSNYNAVVPLATTGSIPAAPTNLGATPGTSSIALTWTDNSSNETAFNIQRSTDDSTWTTIHSTGANATSWSDSTATLGTEYYYQVNASNGSGGSAYDGISCGVATVIGYEGFNYATAGTWNGNGTTAVGFTGNWSITNSSNASIVSGLTYNTGGHALTTAGNALQLKNSDKATGTLSQSVGSSGSTVWVGYEFSTYRTSTTQALAAEVDLGSGTNVAELGDAWNTDINARVIIGTQSYFMTSSDVTTANTTYFMVYSIAYATGGDVISMWYDPTPGVTPGAATSTLTLPSSAQLSSTSTVTLDADDFDSVPTFDELRLSTSYLSVAPDPLVGGNANTNASPKHHPSRGHRTTPFLDSVSTDKLATSSDVIIQTAKTNASQFYPGLNGGSWRWVDDADNTVLFSAASNNADGSWQSLFN